MCMVCMGEKGLVYCRLLGSCIRFFFIQFQVVNSGINKRKSIRIRIKVCCKKVLDVSGHGAGVVLVVGGISG